MQDHDTLPMNTYVQYGKPCIKLMNNLNIYDTATRISALQVLA